MTLIRRYALALAWHGRAMVGLAFTQANRIIEEWIHRPSYRDRFHQLMHRFHGSEWHKHSGHLAHMNWPMRSTRLAAASGGAMLGRRRRIRRCRS